MKRLAFVFSFALACSALNAQADDVLHVGKAVPPDFGFTVANVGVAAGTFAKHGLQVDPIDFGGAPKMHQAMIAGSVDIGLSGGPDLAVIAKGAPELAIAVLANEPRGLEVYARDGSGIATIQDLKGRKVGVSAEGSLSAWLVLQLAHQQGWPPNAVDLIALGAPTAIAAALRTGQIDAMFIDLTLASQLDTQHVGKAIVNFGDVVKNFHIEVIFATLDAIQHRPDAVRRFVAGWFDTLAWMRTHKDETVEILVPFTHADPVALAGIYDQLMPTFSKDGRFDPKALAVLGQSLVDLKLVEAMPAMSTFYTEAFLPENPDR
jgi:ABC-type nitrate/sulfonate/bicarbonate transport system substrate-binding protein